MPISSEILLFLFGISIGSFLNVFLGRYNPDKDNFLSLSRTKGRSHCDSCGKTLRWFELIPLVSFFIQRGKCRSCKKGISSVDSIIELASGIIFISVPLMLHKFSIFWFLQSHWIFITSSIIWILVMLALISVIYVDTKFYVIPNVLNFSIFILAIAWVALLNIFTKVNSFNVSFLHQYSQVFPVFNNQLWNSIFGMAFGALFFFLIVYLSKGKGMGIGDVKLIGALGLLFGWPDILVIIMLAFIIGSIYSLALMLFKKKKFRDKVQFGPFISIGVILTFYFGFQLLALYFNIIMI